MTEKPLFEEKKLSRYIDLLDREKLNCSSAAAIPPEYSDRIVKDISFDSRRCTKDSIFFCKGSAFCEKFLESAADNGAFFFIYEKNTPAQNIAENYADASRLCVSDIKKAMALISAFHYDYPMKSLITVAVTGTKGKTTTVQYIKNIFDQCEGAKAEILSECTSDSALTTPEAPDLHKAAAVCRQNGVTHLICEISSQAQKLLRTYNITFDFACFTNFGNDHISPSEHSDTEDYFNAKLSLFDQCNCAVLNYDCERTAQIISHINSKCQVISYSFKNPKSDFFGFDAEPRCEGNFFTIKAVKENSPDEVFPVILSSLGIFNAQNALCAAAVCMRLGATPRCIFKGLMCAKVEGRMEVFESNDGKITLFVDYAHNKMSFEALFDTVKRRFPETKITSIFGCPGGKSHNRRKDLPSVAKKYSDKIIICEDDSWIEDFNSISSEICASLSDFTDFEIIKDREEAVNKAVEDCSSGTNRVILFVGKGHERTMKLKQGDVPYISDIIAAESAISRYNKTIDTQKLFSSLSIHKNSFICISADLTPKDFAAFEYLAESCKRYISIGARLTLVLTPECEKVFLLLCNRINLDVSEFSKKKRCENKLSLLISNSLTNLTASLISVTEKADFLIFYGTQGGLMLKNNLTLPRLSSESAINIFENTDSKDIKYMSEIVFALKNGVPICAVLDGNHPQNLSYFGTGSGFKGTIIG